ncbi:uncharacterized protein ACIBXB_018566 [Morphnus guianensis]
MYQTNSKTKCVNQVSPRQTDRKKVGQDTQKERRMKERKKKQTERKIKEERRKREERLENIERKRKKRMERKKKKERKKTKTERESKKKKRARKRHRKDGQTDNDRRTKRKARRAALCRSPFAHPLSRTWSGLGWECWHHGSVPVAVPARGPAGSPGARRGSLPRCSSLVSPGRPDPARYRCAASRAPAASPSRSPPAAGTPEQRQRAALPRPGPAARSCPGPPLLLSGDFNRPVPSRGSAAGARPHGARLVPLQRRRRDRAPGAAPGAAPARAAAGRVRGSARQPRCAPPVGAFGTRGWGRRQ